MVSVIHKRNQVIREQLPVTEILAEYIIDCLGNVNQIINDKKVYGENCMTMGNSCIKGTAKMVRKCKVFL